jgi:hypothetical protein
MTEQTFINDIINTNQTDYLSAIRLLLSQNNFNDNLFDLLTLLHDIYNLPQSNINIIITRYLNNESFDISSYEN